MLRISVLVVVLLATSCAIAATPSIGKAAAHDETKNDISVLLGNGTLGLSVQTKALVGGWSISFQAPPTLPSCSKPGPLEPCCPPHSPNNGMCCPGEPWSPSQCGLSKKPK